MLQYLHETAAFSFSADKKACGDAGDLGRNKTKQRDRSKKRDKESERGQGALNESFIE